MRLLRNREVRRELLLLTGITAALCAVGWAMAGPCCAGLLLVSGAASAAVYLVSARRRYRALADMSQDIDRVLHGLDSQTIAACDEGELAWIKKKDLLALPAWEGDKIFLRLLDEDTPFFSLKLRYEGETLAEAKLNGEEIEVRHG